MAFLAYTPAHRDTFVMIAFLAARANRISLYIINCPVLITFTPLDEVLGFSVCVSISIVEEYHNGNKPYKTAAEEQLYKNTCLSDFLSF